MQKHIPAKTRREAIQIGEHFSDWRKLTGLKLSEVAERAGVSINTVRDLESGKGSTSLINVLQVARVLSVDHLLAEALDPYNTELGRARSAEKLPQRVRS